MVLGNTANLSVVADGTPNLSYQWYKGNTPLSNAGSISGSGSPALTITGAQNSDAGSYHVTVASSGSGATVTSSSATLAVNTAAIVTLTPGTLTHRVGDHLAFVATASGTSPFTYAWTHNGNNIAGANSSTLALTNIQTGDTGTYAVSVNNAANIPVSASSTLNVSSGFLPLSSANLIVSRIGDGAQALNAITGNTIYLDQFQPDGTYVSTIMIPDTPTSAFGTNQTIQGKPTGTNIMLTGMGTSDGVYETGLTRSANGKYINFVAYNVSYPSALVIGNAGNMRGIGAVNALGYYALTYTNSGLYTGGNAFFRTAVSDDGLTNFWTVGAASQSGLKYVQWGAPYANGNNIPNVGGSGGGSAQSIL